MRSAWLLESNPSSPLALFLLVAWATLHLSRKWSCSELQEKRKAQLGQGSCSINSTTLKLQFSWTPSSTPWTVYKRKWLLRKHQEHQWDLSEPHPACCIDFNGGVCLPQFDQEKPWPCVWMIRVRTTHRTISITGHLMRTDGLHEDRLPKHNQWPISKDRNRLRLISLALKIELCL